MMGYDVQMVNSRDWKDVSRILWKIRKIGWAGWIGVTEVIKVLYMRKTYHYMSVEEGER